MKKADIAARIAEVKNAEIDRERAYIKVASHTLEDVIAEIGKALVRGENVYIRGFGTFSIILKKAKVGRHIKHKHSVQIPAYYAVKFKPSNVLKGLIKKIPVNGIPEDKIPKLEEFWEEPKTVTASPEPPQKDDDWNF